MELCRHQRIITVLLLFVFLIDVFLMAQEGEGAQEGGDGYHEEQNNPPPPPPPPPRRRPPKQRPPARPFFPAPPSIQNNQSLYYYGGAVVILGGIGWFIYTRAFKEPVEDTENRSKRIRLTEDEEEEIDRLEEDFRTRSRRKRTRSSRSSRSGRGKKKSRSSRRHRSKEAKPASISREIEIEPMTTEVIANTGGNLNMNTTTVKINNTEKESESRLIFKINLEEIEQCRTMVKEFVLTQRAKVETKVEPAIDVPGSVIAKKDKSKNDDVVMKAREEKVEVRTKEVSHKKEKKRKKKQAPKTKITSPSTSAVLTSPIVYDAHKQVKGVAVESKADCTSLLIDDFVFNTPVEVESATTKNSLANSKTISRSKKSLRRDNNFLHSIKLIRSIGRLRECFEKFESEDVESPKETVVEQHQR